MRDLWLNMDTCMLYEQAGKRILGRKIKYEALELNHLKIDGKFYRFGEIKRSLVQIIPTQEKQLDDFDTQIQCEEIYADA